MNQSTHAMLRLLSDDAGLGTPVETRYDPTRRGRKRIAATLGTFAAGLTMAAAVLAAYLN